MRAASVLEELEIFGSSQWGLVTTAQARALGIDRLWLSRMSARGTLQRIRHGVYALPSARHGPFQDLQATWLSTEPDLAAESRLHADDPVTVSHISAAGVHHLGDLVPARHEFSSPARRQTTQPDIQFHRQEVPPHDRVWIDGLPVTSVPRTVADLAEAAVDFDHLARVVRDAVAEHNVVVTDLAERLFPHVYSYGADSGSELVESLLNHTGFFPPDSRLAPNSWQATMSELITPELEQLLRKEIRASLSTFLDDGAFAHGQKQVMAQFTETLQQVLRQAPGLSDAVAGMSRLPRTIPSPPPPAEEHDPRGGQPLNTVEEENDD